MLKANAFGNIDKAHWVSAYLNSRRFLYDMSYVTYSAISVTCALHDPSSLKLNLCDPPVTKHNFNIKYRKSMCFLKLKKYVKGYRDTTQASLHDQ